MSLADQNAAGSDWLEIREAIIERDKYRCTNCTRPKEVVESFHIDHSVSRGRGGSDRFSNLRTLCRQCHGAKHGEGYAPMIELKSTGAMDEYTFHYFHHFIDQMLPAMGRSIGIRLDPKFRIDDRRDVWFISLGDIRHADAVLATFDKDYTSFQTVDYD